MIETKSAAIQLEVQRRATIAAYATQRFAENAAPITAKQAIDIDAALTALQTSLAAAGFGGTSPNEVVVSNNSNITVKNAGGTSTSTAKVVAGALVETTLPATVALVKSGPAGVAATGTGTTVTLTVAAGKISAIALS